MARAFESVIRLQLEKYGPEAAKRKHIEVARKGLSDFLRRQNPKPGYEIETDGRPATNEESVKPFGVITYRFRRMREIGLDTRAVWLALAPEESGDYKRSISIFVDGKEVSWSEVPQTADEMIVVATVPYARKIHTRGARRKNVPPGIAEKVVQMIRRKYGAIVTVSLDFISITGAYKLKRSTGRGKKQRHVTLPAAVIRRKM